MNLIDPEHAETHATSATPPPADSPQGATIPERDALTEAVRAHRYRAFVYRGAWHCAFDRARKRTEQRDQAREVAVALEQTVADAVRYLAAGDVWSALARLQADGPLPPCGTPGPMPEHADCARPDGHGGAHSPDADYVDPPHVCPTPRTDPYEDDWQADEQRAAADPRDLAEQGKDLDDEDDFEADPLGGTW